MLNRSFTLSSRFSQLFNNNAVIKQRTNFLVPNARCSSSSMGFSSSRKTLLIGAAIVGSYLGYEEYKRKQIPMDSGEVFSEFLSFSV